MPLRPLDPPVRRLSCTPWSRADLNRSFDCREGREDFLVVDAQLFEPYQEVFKVTQYPGRAIFYLDKKYVLKLLPAVLDVDAIVRTMRMASSVVPVPRVHRHGRSGNSCYILMDLVQGPDLFDVRLLHKMYPAWVITAKLEHSLGNAVRALRAQGIFHFDLYSTNIFIDRYWQISAVIDWDWAHAEPCGDEYLLRLENGPFRPHDWDYLFARCGPLGMSFVSSPVDGAAREGPRPYIPPGYGSARPDDVEHVLDPLSLVVQPRNTKRLAVLDNSNGIDTLHALDPRHEGQEYRSIKGFRLTKLFTMEKSSPEILRRKIPTMAYGDMIPQLALSPDQEFARLLTQACPDLVLLLNWALPLLPTFYEAMSVPTDLADETSRPVVLRISIHVSPIFLRVTNPGDESLSKVVAIITAVIGYAGPEITLHIHQTPAFDSSIAGAVEHHRAAAQRWAVRTAIERWGRSDQHPQ